MKELKEKLKSYKALVVDDEPDIRNNTSTFLAKLFDKVLVCENGEEGLEVFKNNKDIKLIFTDNMMPKMDGITMIQEIRKISSDVDIVLLTGFTTDEITITSSLNFKCITKPLTFDTLISILKEIN